MSLIEMIQCNTLGIVAQCPAQLNFRRKRHDRDPDVVGPRKWLSVTRMSPGSAVVRLAEMINTSRLPWNGARFREFRAISSAFCSEGWPCALAWKRSKAVSMSAGFPVRSAHFSARLSTGHDETELRDWVLLKVLRHKCLESLVSGVQAIRRHVPLLHSLGHVHHNVSVTQDPTLQRPSITLGTTSVSIALDMNKETNDTGAACIVRERDSCEGGLPRPPVSPPTSA